MSNSSTMGLVIGCAYLKIFREPTQDSDIICSLKHMSKVMIDLDESTVDFDKIYTEAGIEGFCNKNHILEL